MGGFELGSFRFFGDIFFRCGGIVEYFSESGEVSVGRCFRFGRRL